MPVSREARYVVYSGNRNDFEFLITQTQRRAGTITSQKCEVRVPDFNTQTLTHIHRTCTERVKGATAGAMTC